MHRVLVPWEDFDSPDDALAAVAEASRLGAWEDIGIKAVDGRVLYRIGDRGVYLYFNAVVTVSEEEWTEQ